MVTYKVILRDTGTWSRLIRRRDKEEGIGMVVQMRMQDLWGRDMLRWTLWGRDIAKVEPF